MIVVVQVGLGWVSVVVVVWGEREDHDGKEVNGLSFFVHFRKTVSSHMNA